MAIDWQGTRILFHVLPRPDGSYPEDHLREIMAGEWGIPDAAGEVAIHFPRHLDRFGLEELGILRNLLLQRAFVRVDPDQDRGIVLAEIDRKTAERRSAGHDVYVHLVDAAAILNRAEGTTKNALRGSTVRSIRIPRNGVTWYCLNDLLAFRRADPRFTVRKLGDFVHLVHHVNHQGDCVKPCPACDAV